jgi:hypothetical protein
MYFCFSPALPVSNSNPCNGDGLDDIDYRQAAPEKINICENVGVIIFPFR